jgi:hypothetical protein
MAALGTNFRYNFGYYIEMANLSFGFKSYFNQFVKYMK